MKLFFRSLEMFMLFFSIVHSLCKPVYLKIISRAIPSKVYFPSSLQNLKRKILVFYQDHNLQSGVMMMTMKI